jgi:hypothetical protein
MNTSVPRLLDQLCSRHSGDTAFCAGAVLLITALSLRALENWQAYLNETRFPDDHI